MGSRHIFSSHQWWGLYSFHWNWLLDIFTNEPHWHSPSTHQCKDIFPLIDCWNQEIFPSTYPCQGEFFLMTDARTFFSPLGYYFFPTDRVFFSPTKQQCWSISSSHRIATWHTTEHFILSVLLYDSYHQTLNHMCYIVLLPCIHLNHSQYRSCYTLYSPEYSTVYGILQTPGLCIV